MEHHKLCMLYDESPFFKRYFPGTRLHYFILDLEEEIMTFFRDAWVSSLRRSCRLFLMFL